MSKLDYATKDFVEEYKFLQEAKKNYFVKKLKIVKKKFPDLTFKLKKPTFPSLTPMYMFPDAFCLLGITWQFGYLLVIEGNKPYCEFYIRYEKDIDAAIDYYLYKSVNEYGEENLYVIDGYVYNSKSVQVFRHSFKAFLTNFYVMDNKYGDIARRFVNEPDVSYNDNNFYVLLHIANKICRKMDVEKKFEFVMHLKELWNLYKELGYEEQFEKAKLEK